MISGTLNPDRLLIYIHWKLTWHPKIKILKFVVASFSEKPGFSFHLNFLKACSFWYGKWNSPKETWNIEIGKSKFIFTKLVNGLSHLLISGVYWGYNPLILTFDPNFCLGTSKRSSSTSFWENLWIFLSNPQGFGMQIFNGIFRDPQYWDPFPILVPYHSQMNPQRYGNGMGIVWEA